MQQVDSNEHATLQAPSSPRLQFTREISSEVPFSISAMQRSKSFIVLSDLGPMGNQPVSDAPTSEMCFITNQGNMRNEKIWSMFHLTHGLTLASYLLALSVMVDTTIHQRSEKIAMNSSGLHAPTTFGRFWKLINRRNLDESQNMEPYMLRARKSVFCLNSPIDVEWKAPVLHNSQVI